MIFAPALVGVVKFSRNHFNCFKDTCMIRFGVGVRWLSLGICYRRLRDDYFVVSTNCVVIMPSICSRPILCGFCGNPIMSLCPDMPTCFVPKFGLHLDGAMLESTESCAGVFLPAEETQNTNMTKLKSCDMGLPENRVPKLYPWKLSIFPYWNIWNRLVLVFPMQPFVPCFDWNEELGHFLAQRGPPVKFSWLPLGYGLDTSKIWKERLLICVSLSRTEACEQWPFG